ncbi:MAG: ABC-ATPase domain-containing protein [Pseudomonadota bacterium]
MQSLKKKLKDMHGRGYKSYKSIQDIYLFDNFSLSIDHVQGDPFAQPSRINVRVAMHKAAFPLSSWTGENGSTIRRIALEDYLSRSIQKNIKRYCKGLRGSGVSGIINIECNAQKILLRNAVLVTSKYIEARMVIGLPASNRRVDGFLAQQMFFEELPRIIEQSLYYKNLSQTELFKHIYCAEDQQLLRAALKERGLVAFIANSSLLARQSGISDKPKQQNTIKFLSPASLECQFILPHTGKISGMGIPQGVSLIVGGGFHGKSTLLHALEQGIYNHIPADGREQVVSNENAVKIRSEDGRIISCVNISPFIDHLPFAKDSKKFSTENASGSTSQATNIIEALECNSELLLIDEDTSATNFMIRDARMQALVSQEKEPITPLLYRIRELYEQYGVSSIIVMGGSGDYFDIADTVIMMDEYLPHNVTKQAALLASDINVSLADKWDNLPPFKLASQRKPGPKTLDAARNKFPVKIEVRETRAINYGNYHIDLSLVEQLVDLGQTRSIALMIHYYATHYSTASGTLVENLTKIIQLANDQGLDIFSPYKVGNLAIPRLYELHAAINRIRCDDWL